jgi:uncharacterized protein
MKLITLNPIRNEKRIAIIDILRGWALLGVVLMNYTDVYFFLGKPTHPDAFNNILITIGGIVFESKSWTLLSFLFGYGFAVLINNIESKGINPVPFFSKRMFWLLVLAFINSAVFFGDILKDYAVLGMVLLIFRRSSAKTAFFISIALLLVNPAVVAYVVSLNINGVALAAPYFPLYQSHNVLEIFKCGLFATYKFEMLNPFYSIACHETILLCFFLGLAAQKIDFFGRLTENKKYVRRIFWYSFGFTLMMWAIFIIVPKVVLGEIFKYYTPMFWLILSIMLFTASAICWLYLSGKLERFFAAMQLYGKMTLTNYIVQNILAVLIFSGVGLRLGAYGFSYGIYMLVAIAIYIAQIYFSKWWLTKYFYGPIEWLWRLLSYGKKLAIKRDRISEAI